MILRKQRPAERHNDVLLIYAARHCRELSAQNELRPQDMMRILIHYHAYGDPEKVPSLIAEHGTRIRKQVDLREEDEIGRLESEFKYFAERISQIDSERMIVAERLKTAETQDNKTAANSAVSKREKTRHKAAKRLLAKREKQRQKAATKLAERDDKIAECKRRAESDRQDIENVGTELLGIYGDPHELLKHARVVKLEEIEENEFNLNIPRYVDTFEPEPHRELDDALKALDEAAAEALCARDTLSRLLKDAGCVD